MSTGKIEKIFLNELEPTDQQLILDSSKAYIPFSNISETAKSEYIYTGNEEIPFKERHPIYQELFIYEFLQFENNLIKCVS
ncbi:MAG: hypothetical protein ACFE9S_06520 [Candidatus Hermodarchaeota archaeon]